MDFTSVATPASFTAATSTPFPLYDLRGYKLLDDPILLIVLCLRFD